MNERNIIEKENQEGNFWAILVGVNKYDDSDIPNLNFCVNDVKALEVTLTKLGYSVVCLHDELDNEHYPTRQNVKKKLHILSQLVQPNDLLWVHFSCHGTVTDTEKKEPVLILKDTQHLLLNDEYEVLSVARVENYMRKSGARKLILTLDACHSGVNIGRDVSNQEEFFQNVYKKAEGFVLLAAATANQEAYEADKNGIFTHFLLKGLNSQELRGNKNFITVYQLYTYVLNELRKWGFKNSKLQFPTQRVEGLGDFILAYYQENYLKINLPLVKPVTPPNPGNPRIKAITEQILPNQLKEEETVILDFDKEIEEHLPSRYKPIIDKVSGSTTVSVYKARDNYLERDVAIKVFHGDKFVSFTILTQSSAIVR